MANIATDTTDHDLIAQFKEGSMEAMEAIVDRYENRIFNFGLKMCGQFQDAEDITQDTFLNAFRYLDNFREETKLKSWLFKIVYNLTMDFLRKQSLQHSYQESLNSHVSEVNSLERSLLAAEQKKQLHQALFDLPERQRTALTLFLVNGLSGREVASVLELSIEASDSLLARARRNLKKTIQQESQIKKAANL